MVRFRFLDCGFVIVGSWCPVKLLRVFLLWLVLLALPSQGMGAGILADCERAHTTTKKLRKMQPQRPPPLHAPAMSIVMTTMEKPRPFVSTTAASHVRLAGKFRSMRCWRD